MLRIDIFNKPKHEDKKKEKNRGNSHNWFEKNKFINKK